MINKQFKILMAIIWILGLMVINGCGSSKNGSTTAATAKVVQTTQPTSAVVNTVTTTTSSNDDISITVDGDTIKAPAGSKIKISKIRPNTYSENRTGAASNADITSNSDKILENVDNSSPTAGVGDVKGSGGSFKFSTKLIGGVHSDQLIFYIIGIICLIAGIVGLWASLFPNKIAIGLIIAGVATIAAGVAFTTYPIVSLIILVSAIAGGIAYFMYQHIQQVKATEVAKAQAAAATTAVATTTAALTTVVKGVENAPPDAQTAVKASIGTAAASSPAPVKTLITKIKTDLGL